MKRFKLREKRQPAEFFYGEVLTKRKRRLCAAGHKSECKSVSFNPSDINEFPSFNSKYFVLLNKLYFEIYDANISYISNKLFFNNQFVTKF